MEFSSHKVELGTCKIHGITPENKELRPSTGDCVKLRLTLSQLLKRIVMGFGKGARSGQYYLLTRSRGRETDDAESDLELDSCSL
jgi:hypothetical protein